MEILEKGEREIGCREQRSIVYLYLFALVFDCVGEP